MNDLYVALPAQSMEKMLLRRNDADSHEILTAWVSVYHPEVLRRTRRVARPFYTEYTYEEFSDAILVLPYSAFAMLDEHWLGRARERGCVLLTACTDMEKMVAEICEALDVGAGQAADGGSPEADDVSQDTGDVSQAAEKNTPDAERSSLGMPAGMDVAEKAEDFLALGMMHLLSELLSRRMNYASTMDDYGFQKNLLAALDAFLAGNAAETEDALRIAWDQIIQSRQYYSHADGYFFDLTLLAPEVLKDTRLTFLREALAGGEKMNLLADGATVRKLAAEFPELAADVRAAISQGKLTLLGGEEAEACLPLLTQEGVLKHLTAGLSVYQKALGERPRIFARRRFGLTPMLPGILKGLKYDAALHTALDDGVFPVPSQTRIRWEGADGEYVEAFAGVPSDAKNAGEILVLPETVGQAVNTDTSRGLMFAHWPGEKETSVWFRLWKRSARYVPLFGELSTFQTCLDNTRYSGQTQRFLADEYASAYLVQDVAADMPDPISRWMLYHRTRMELEALASLEGMREWMTGRKPGEMQRVEAALEELQRNVTGYSRVWYEMVQTRMNAFRKRYAEEIAESLCGKKAKKKNPLAAVLVLNPWNFAKKETVNLTAAEAEFAASFPDAEGEIRPVAGDGGVSAHLWEKASGGTEVSAAEESRMTHAARVEVPPCGFSVITDSPQGQGSPEKKKRSWLTSLFTREKTRPVPIFQDTQSNAWIMRNEHLELRFDPYTGYLRSVYDNIHRGNRLSQQLGMRLKPAPLGASSDEDYDDYTIMAADDFLAGYDATGCRLRVTGRLVDRNGEIAARFTQVTSLLRGTPIIEFHITLDPVLKPKKNPWQSYYANRFVWGDTEADIFRNVGIQAAATSARKLEAPLFIEVRPIQIGLSTAAVDTVSKTVSEVLRRGKELPDAYERPRDPDAEYRESRRITFLTCGLPYHRLIGSRRLDSLLIVHGETQREFRMGVCLDSAYPAQTAVDFMTSPVRTSVQWNTAAQKPLTGWMMHTDRRNVIVTHWETTPRGAMIRLAETQGRRCVTRIRAYRDIRSASLTNFLGDLQQTLRVESGAAVVDIPPSGWVQVEVEF